MQFDAHVHSAASPDSEMNPAEAVSVLSRQGLGVIFTEHVDYVTPLEGRDDTAMDVPKAKRDYLADWDIYPGTYRALQSESVGLGLEIGLTRAFLPLNRLAAAQEDWDFIIGSIHFVDGGDLYKDYVQNAPDDPYRRMLTYTREMVEISDFFDSLGHIDYISRYTPLEEKDVRYDRYAEEYDALLSVLAAQGKALEINTSRFGDKAAEANLYRIYKRFRALGGRDVTIGSDAHQPEKLGRCHSQALRMADEAGLTAVYFKKRKRYVC